MGKVGDPCRPGGAWLGRSWLGRSWLGRSWLGRNDPEQVRLVTRESLRWIVRHRAWTPWYLVRYARLLRLRLTRPHVVLRGMVFLGKNVEITARPGFGRLEIGRWVHIGDGCALRAHEGSLRVGDKAVLGAACIVNCYLDVEIGGATLLADGVYVVDFDHRTDDVHRPVKDQGIVKSPVRIGPDGWVGTKVSVLRDTRLGRGVVLGAHAVARGEIPDFAIAVGSPARVIRDRRADYDAAADHRAVIADIARKTNDAVRRRSATGPVAGDDSGGDRADPGEHDGQ